MADRIDELQLLIGSDASKAIEQLNALAGALDTAASSTRKLSGATGFLSSFSVGLQRIANTNLDKAIGNLERLSKLDLSNLKDKTVNIDLRVNGADRVDRLKYATEQTTKSVVKDTDQIAKALGQEYKMDTSSVADMKAMLREYVETLKSGGDTTGFMEGISEHIAANSRKSSAEILGLKQQMTDFLDYVNHMEFSPGKGVSSDARQFLTSLGLERQWKNGQVGLDALWQEDSFKKVAAGFVDLQETNPENMFWQLGEAVMSCRQSLGGYVDDAESFARVNGSVQSSLEKIDESFNEGITKRMAQSKNAIPLDLDVDQSRFESKIQEAITKATDKKTYTAKPIQFNLDVDQLRRNIEQTIASVDFDKLPGFAENFGKMSDAISQMNQVSLKDTGVTQFANAINRIVSTDTSKFDVSVLNAIAAAIKDMASIGDVSRGLNSFVGSLARLANAGDKTEKTADGMKKLTPELKNAVTTITSLGAVDATLTSFIASLSKLASAGDKTATTADNLKKLSDAVVEFLNALSGAPEINDNIANTIQGLGNLAAAGNATGKAMNSVLNGGGSGGGGGFARSGINTFVQSTTSAMKGLLSVSLQLGKQGSSALGDFLAKLRLIPSQATSIDRTALTFGNLLRAVLPFYGIRGLFEWGKEALEAGSSIVELENVIDTSFGNLKKGYEDISGYVYKWAQSTIDAFGVSQIAAEKYAGRLMAMFNSSGFDLTEGMRDSAAQMSVDLIERAGDIASFYDITVDEAMTKVQAGLAGMNRPLRSLGVNMTVANLEAFALSQGITTAWKSMDQATQMALRYKYILNATQYAENDFQRTSMSLANQLRLLTLNFQMLSTTIGQGLVSAIAPVISWLNLLIKRLIQAANAFRTFMWTLFGKPLQALRGTSDDMAGYLDDASGAAGGLADSAGGASDNLGKAGKAAKDLKKQLQVLPFDELNQLAKDTDTASSGGSGGGGGGVGGGGLGGLTDLGLGSLGDFDLSGSDLADKINRWALKIRRAFMAHDWPELGKTIAEGLNSGLEKIYSMLSWQKVGPKIRAFIQPFHDTINSMMAEIDWGLLGLTLSRGLNTVVKSLRIWINGFHWRDYGKDLAKGLNSFVDEWDADEFGRLLADKFRAAWNFFEGFVEDFDFKDLGKKLKEMFHGAMDEMEWSDMGDTLAGFFNGVSDAIIEFFEGDTVVNDISEAFSTFVNSFLEKFDSEKAKQAMQTVKTALTKALGDTIRGINKDDMQKAFEDLMEGLPWSAIGLAIGATAGAKLAAGIFGVAFQAAALKAIMGVGGGATATASTASAVGTGASAGVGASAGAGSLAGLGGTLGAISVSLAALVGFMKIGESASNIWARSKGVTETATDKTKSRKMFTNDYDADVVSAPKVSSTGYTDPMAQDSTVTIKANEDSSFKKAIMDVANLSAFPIITKILNSEQSKSYKDNLRIDKAWGDSKAEKRINARVTNAYNTVHSNWDRWLSETITKHANAQTTSAYNGIKTDYYKWISETITKMTNAQKTRAYNVVQSDYVHWIGNTALKTADATTTKAYDETLKSWHGFDDKWIKIHLEADLSDMVKRVRAATANGDYVNVLWTTIDYYAKGGLFNHAAVFGEAGAEAAIPLERKSTMKRIASAIVDSGGMATGSNSGLAREIAQAVAPYIMEAVAETNNRPLNVQATLYTENDEVLARAVTRGQKSIDKRYNPVSQFSY